ncbi:hypothetical protein [Heyndrickxia sporothermodurans]
MTKAIDYAAETLRAAENAQIWRKSAAEAHQILAELARAAAEDETARAALVAAAAKGSPVEHDKLDSLNAARAKREHQREFQQEVIARADDNLRRAEAEHVAAIRRERSAKAREIADLRVACGRRWDLAMSEALSALSTWDALGQELAALDVVSMGRTGVSAWESAIGYNRVAAAFPNGIVKKLFPQASGLFAGDASLAASEASMWRDLPAS